MMPGIARMAVSGSGRNDGAYRSSGNRLASTPPNVNGFDHASLDELAQGRMRDADVATDADKPDTPLGDEPSREPLAGTEQLGNLGDGQQAVTCKDHVHITPPLCS